MTDAPQPLPPAPGFMDTQAGRHKLVDIATASLGHYLEASRQGALGAAAVIAGVAAFSPVGGPTLTQHIGLVFLIASIFGCALFHVINANAQFGMLYHLRKHPGECERQQMERWMRFRLVPTCVGSAQGVLLLAGIACCVLGR